MTTSLPPTIEVEPQGPARAAVIALHGLGASGADLAPLAAECGLDPALGVRWVFPSAPLRRLGITGGAPMSAWFDVAGEDLREGRASDLGGLRAADLLVRGLIEREVARGVPTARIVVGGFSQGGALACYVSVRFEKPLAGAFALSTYLARNVEVEAQAVCANRGLAVFAAHGTEDVLVPVSRGHALRRRLEDLGCVVTWREYPMDHALCVEEIADLGRWLASVLR